MKPFSAVVTLLAGLFAPGFCSAQGSLPSIMPGGVVSASSFGQFKSIAPGSWIEIYGSNLAIDSRTWAGSDFNGVNAPTSLDGTTVTIGGQPAFIDYISPSQVNAQVPSNVASGSQQVIVTTATGPSAPYTITVNATEAGLLAPASFNVGGVQYTAALFTDGVTYVLPPGAIPGVTSRRAQPGDAITLYGVGFGPVVPSIPAGQIVGQSNTLASALQIKFGATLATTTYDGLAPSAVGLYQFNVTVPNIPGSDTVPLTFTLGGVPGTQTLSLAVQNPNATPQVQSLTLSASSVSGGGTVQGTVTLSAAAPAGGAVVALSSNSSAATVPATVTVPAGATSTTFTIAAGSASSNQTATITASYGGGSAQAALTVTGGTTTSPFWVIEINATFSTSSQTSLGGINIYPGVGGTLSGVTIVGPPSVSSVPFMVSFDAVSVTGQTYTLSAVHVGAGSIEISQGGTYPITAGSATVTLISGADVHGQSAGTVTGSFTLTSALGTMTGTISGSFTGI